MKSAGYCALIAFLLVASCKKQNTCDNVVCGLHQHCNNGVCQCDSGWRGPNCDTSTVCDNIICGPHQHCVNGSCECDSGWVGSDCLIEIPIASWQGYYHLVGVSHNTQNGTDTYIDDTVRVVQFDKYSFLFGGDKFVYNRIVSSSFDFKCESNGVAHLYQYVKFHVVPDDSVFYNLTYGPYVSTSCL